MLNFSLKLHIILILFLLNNFLNTLDKLKIIIHYYLYYIINNSLSNFYHLQIFLKILHKKMIIFFKGLPIFSNLQLSIIILNYHHLQFIYYFPFYSHFSLFVKKYIDFYIHY